MSQPARIIFAGSPEFAVPPLQALIESPHEVVAVLTQPDRPSGRGRNQIHLHNVRRPRRLDFMLRSQPSLFVR